MSKHSSSGSLAEAILSTSDPTDVPGSLRAAHQALTGENLNAFQFKLATGILAARTAVEDLFVRDDSDHSVYQRNVDLTERRVASIALHNIFVRGNQRPNTLLNSWPLFDHLHRRYGREQQTPHSRALLVGSLSSLTSRAFTVMANDVFNAERAFVTDIRSGKDKKRPENGTFIYGNGLQLPFRNESMNTVCTNFLLHMIVDADGRTVTRQSLEQGIASGLLGEAYRVLAPGGQLFMREVAPRLDFEDRQCTSKYNRQRMQAFMGDMRAGLTEAGFSNVSVEAGWEKNGVDYLLDADRKFEDYPTLPTPTNIGIYAYKAADTASVLTPPLRYEPLSYMTSATYPKSDGSI